MNNKVELTQEKLKELLNYNPETGLFTWLIPKGRRVKFGTIAGCFHHSGYRQIRIDDKTYLEHRLVWLYTQGSFPKGKQNLIDHVDGDRSNNKLTNLRTCSYSENGMNRGKTLFNKSGYKGVSYNKASGKYRSTITNPLTGQEEYLGGYDTAEEASSVYESKSIDYYGKFHPNHLIEKN